MDSGRSCFLPLFSNHVSSRTMVGRRGGGEGEGQENHLRDRSCLLRCSLRLKARLQNWHLYFFSGAEVFLAGELLAVPGAEGAMCRVDARAEFVSSEDRSQRRWYRSLSELAPVL
jgi:hypothetical protein